MSFGARLQNIRKENKISQTKLGEHIGVARQSISRWENDIGYPEAQKLAKMAEILGTSVEYLEKGEAGKPKDSDKQKTVDPKPAKGVAAEPEDSKKQDTVVRNQVKGVVRKPEDSQKQSTIVNKQAKDKVNEPDDSKKLNTVVNNQVKNKVNEPENSKKESTITNQQVKDEGIGPKNSDEDRTIVFYDKKDVSAKPKKSSSNYNVTSYDILDVFIDSKFTGLKFKAFGLLLILLTIPLIAGFGNIGIILSIISVIAGIVFIVIGRKRDPNETILSEDAILSPDTERKIKEEVSNTFKRCKLYQTLGVILFITGIANSIFMTFIFSESLLWVLDNHKYIIILSMLISIVGILQIIISAMQRNVYKDINDRYKVKAS